MRKIITLAVLLATSSCGGHPAYADEPTVCRSIEGARIVAAEHHNKLLELTQLQFEAVRVALDALGRPVPEGVVKVFATPAIDDNTAMILLGVDKDGCLVGHLVRSIDWFLTTVSGVAS